MTPAAHALVKWWEHLALMYARYGNDASIEQTPEWDEHQERTRLLVDELRYETGATAANLLGALEKSVVVLGNHPTKISLTMAAQIVAETKRQVTEEAKARLRAKTMN